ncbi:hypothetical protein D3C79_776670 [compost metagenome]
MAFPNRVKFTPRTLKISLVSASGPSKAETASDTAPKASAMPDRAATIFIRVPASSGFSSNQVRTPFTTSFNVAMMSIKGVRNVSPIAELALSSPDLSSNH